jgi:Ketopantoate hydroxymethyltransferase
VVLESVPASLGARVADALRIPVVGIGARPDVDAQILVWQDMAGLTPGRLPRLVKRYADIGGELARAASAFVADVACGCREPCRPMRPGRIRGSVRPVGRVAGRVRCRLVVALDRVGR